MFWWFFYFKILLELGRTLGNALIGSRLVTKLSTSILSTLELDTTLGNKIGWRHGEELGTLLGAKSISNFRTCLVSKRGSNNNENEMRKMKMKMKDKWIDDIFMVEDNVEEINLFLSVNLFISFRKNLFVVAHNFRRKKDMQKEKNVLNNRTALVIHCYLQSIFIVRVYSITSTYFFIICVRYFAWICIITICRKCLRESKGDTLKLYENPFIFHIWRFLNSITLAPIFIQYATIHTIADTGFFLY
jgi:hypothetical protein